MAKSVLIIKSNYALRESLNRILIKNGFEIAGEADDGESAIRLYAQLHPDLLIMSLVMPILGGIEAAKKILSQDPGATIIISSSPTDRYLIKEVTDTGISGIIKEPFYENKVMKVLNWVMQMKELQLGNRRFDRLKFPLLIKFTRLPKKSFSLLKREEAVTINISSRGILFGTREIIPVGTNLEMILEFPHDIHDVNVTLTGEAVRVEEVPTTGMHEIAVRFTSLGDDVKSKIEKFIDSQSRR